MCAGREQALSGVQFTDGFDRPERIVLGLEAAQVATLVAGVVCADLVLHTPLPAVLGWPVALLLALACAVCGIGRYDGRPLTEWAALAVRHALATRDGGAATRVVLAQAPDGTAPTDGDRPAAVPAPLPPVSAADTGDDAGPPDEPPWARWLREGGARRPAARTAPRSDVPSARERDRAADAQPSPEATDAMSDDAGPGALAPTESSDDDAGGWRPAGRAPAAPSRDVRAGTDEDHLPEAHHWPAAGADEDHLPEPHHPAGARRRGAEGHATQTSATLTGRVRAWMRRRRPADGHATPDDEATDVAVDDVAHEVRLPLPRGTVELDRPALVLLPTPTAARGDTAMGDEPAAGAGADDHDVDEPDDDGAGVPSPPIPLPRLRTDDSLAVAEVAVAPEPDRGTRPGAEAGGVAPVFVGAARRVLFFSLNGGSGRTTLATEVACLLAARGRHRTAPDTPAQPLNVALLDLDTRSSNLAVRLGLAHPTIWDWLLDGGAPERLGAHLVRHRSGLRALVGPPKPLGPTHTPVEPVKLAEALARLEQDGAHFVVIDAGGELGAITTWALAAVHDIFVVITPTAGGVQDAYRSAETLRRLGHGHKIRWVVNRVRGRVDLSEVMSDLGGTLAAVIPYDPRVEEAENQHRSVTLEVGGPAADAITRLATAIYPTLTDTRRRSRLLKGRGRGG